MTSEGARSVARYDEEVVKPALLLADHIRLRTWRVDLLSNEAVESWKSRLPVPLAATVHGVLVRNSPAELELYGIDDRLHRELRLVVDMYGSRTGFPEERLLNSEAISQFANNKLTYHRQNARSLESKALQALQEQGIVEELPWDPRGREGRSIPEASFEFRTNAADAGWIDLVETLQGNGDSGSVMLDAGIGERVSGSHGMISDPRSANVLRNASDLMAMIDGLSDATLDEVVDLRADLAEHMTPFRRFIMRKGADIPADSSMPLAERRRLVSLAWENEVAPSIDELKNRIDSRPFRRNLGRTLAEGPDAAIGIGVGIAAAAAAGTVGVTALAGFGVAALPTIVKAAAATFKDRADANEHEAFFVYEAHKRLRARAVESA
ncbi:hypothetical protein [Nocardioides kribbensis]|uniref:hypothetical protein n=1 Tax=Nocardioides kribbensis TaxID=305517 RepID=UPI00187912FC|nr:hypothetical protein [Nocardioides kribbensis]